MKEDTIKYNNKISGIFGIIICLFPIIFLKEENIANNQELIYHLHNLTKHFQGIENMANVTKPYGLYYYTKIQMIFVLTGMILTFPFNLYSVIKIYLNSLNNIKKDSTKFVLKIKETGTLMSPIRYFPLVLLIIWGIDYIFLNYIFQFGESYIYTFFYNKLGLFIFSAILVYTFPYVISATIVEGIAQLRKFRIEHKTDAIDKKMY